MQDDRQRCHRPLNRQTLSFLPELPYSRTCHEPEVCLSQNFGRQSSRVPEYESVDSDPVFGTSSEKLRVAPQENESRKFGRYNVTYETEVVFESKAITAVITNESIGGVRVEMSTSPDFSVGSKVIIRQDDTETEGYVRNLGVAEGGKMFAGISWQAPEDDSDAASSSNFLNYGELNVVCRERTDLDDGTSKIALWDGATFVTATSSLASCSHDARAAMLQGMPSKLAVLAKLYGIEMIGSRDDLVSQILDFEFPGKPVHAV